MTDRYAHLAEIGETLRSSGYEVAEQRFHSVDHAIVAYSPYAVVGCMEATDWTDLPLRVEDFQAELTKLPSLAGSARRWDLYVVIHMLTRPQDNTAESLVETIESDTRYARKFVRITLPPNNAVALERALRPLLPLQEAPRFDQFDPLAALRGQLRQLAIPDEVAEAAISSFIATNEVTVP